MKNKIEIIAEIGVNHDGYFNKAIKMIDIAKKNGANTVKFQNFSAKRLVKINAKKTRYQLKTTSKKQSHYDMLKKLELSKDEFLKIANYCRKKKIEFLSTPYDLESVEFLEKLKVHRYKIASTDIVDLLLHKKIISTKKPVIISTGASNINEIRKTVNFYKSKKHNKITLLHCVSNYPCSYESINLNVLNTLKSEFKYPIGYSDHSSSNLAAIMSVCFGVSIIEKHFTLNKNSIGPDHEASINPQELKEYINSIRLAEKILGTSKKEIKKEEINIRKISRKSITLKHDLFKNNKISEKDIIMKRPGTSLIGHELFNVLGRKIKKNLKKDHQLSKRDLV
tara:strand:+ start:7736 stop:8749 length:1014 start_codon:yes stop_codon:yes gene_type:complete